MQFRSFAPFLLISFGLACGVLGLYIFLPEQMGAVFGPHTGNHPLFFLAVYAPAIAAFVLVVRTGGLAGLLCFLRRALLVAAAGIVWGNRREMFEREGGVVEVMPEEIRG